MKVIPILLLQHYRSPVTTTAQLWRITRRDGFVLGLTDHDQEIVFDGLSYAPGGFTSSAIRSTADLSVDNLENEALLDDEGITEDDLNAGLWDYAAVKFSRVNYMRPEDGEEVLRRGWIGEVQPGVGAFRAEVRGLAQQLQQTVGLTLTKECRHDLGGPGCGVNLTAHTSTGTVDFAIGRDAFSDAARIEDDGFWSMGTLTWTSGANVGARVEVKTNGAASIHMQEGMPRDIAAGDEYTIKRGCDKTIATCHATYANSANFGGAPYLPGQDQLQSPEIDSAP